ncbi:MAG: C25 family cysteine peptidase, partial [Candidatus Neomarinimicrobiota bacterium]
MRSIAPIVLLCFLLTDAASAEGERIERIILDLPEAETEVTIEEDRIYGLSTATTSIELEGRLVSIYRWILSAGDTGRVSVRLIEGRWDQVENAGFPLFTRPLLQVHSPQVWGQVRVVLLDLFPWRTVNERLEVLKGARVEVTIRHQPEDLLIEADRQPHLSARIANRLLVMAKQPTKPPLRRPTSFLPEAGTWLKIPIKVDGLYRVTGSYLSDAGIALSALEPDRLRLFAPTSLGRPMPDNVGAPLLDNLKELAIFIRDGDDGKMDADDDILLYGQGPRGFNFNNGELTFIQNPYTNEACVWLYIPETGDEPSGQRMAQGAAYSASASVIAAGRSCYHHEVDVFNGFQSGPKWHQEAIKKDSPFRLTLPTPGLRSSDTTYLRVRLRGGNDKGYHQVTLALNQNLILTSPSWSTHSEITLAPHPDAVATAVWTGQNAITLTNITTNPDPQEEVWFDWAEIEYGLDLSADEDLLTFLIGPQGEPVTIQLADFTAPPLVADITDPAQPVLQQVHQADNHWPFTITDLSTTRRYIAATEAKFRTPAPAILYQNLDFTTLRRPEHQADYIIITDPTLLNAAEDLARIHAEEVRPELRLTTLTTTVGEIYEEFSGGVADPLAIRAFLRWAHENWQQPGPRLVLLFGDGDYDYRNLSGLSRILVPTIQVDGSDQTWSRAVDDAFVYLDATPVSSPLPDMGVGRIAVSTPAEAAVIVEMVRTYMVQPEPGPWRQRVLLAADDPVRPNDNEPAFIAQTETLARLLPPYLQVQKIYLTEYTKVLDPATNSVIKPDATADLIRSVNQGVVLINYVGHGSATQWAQEQLLKMERDRILLQPRARLAVWFAGTCAWGRFDQLEISSMSEVLTASTEYAAIGV